MTDLPAAFANALVCFFRKDELICFPEIAVTLASFVGLWNLLPKFAASCLTSITDYKGHDLASSTAHDGPQPAFVPSFVDKWPHFICFQDVFGLGRQKRVFKFWTGFVLFLARRPMSDGWHQRCVESLACWSVRGRRTRSVLSALRCSHVSVRARRVFRSLYTSTADCHWHCDRFLPSSGYRNFDICKQYVLQSYPNYTTHHFNFTTTKILSNKGV